MPFLVIIIVLVIIFHIRLNYLNKNKNVSTNNDSYLKEEFEANYSRPRPIDENMYIKLNESELPFKDDYDETVKIENELLSVQKKVRHCLTSPILKTDIPTNLEVKKRFGVANLQTVIDGEENHINLIRRLNAWAKLLIDDGNDKDAAAVLEKAVFARSDISETYTLLYGLYVKNGDAAKLDALNVNIEKLPDISRKKVVSFMAEGFTEVGHE